MKLDKEFQELIPKLTDEEYSQLEKNCISEGVRDPLVVWQGILIDGHNRYSIAQAKGLSYTTVEREFESREQVVEWIINNQFGRRNINNYQRSVLALRLKSVWQEKAKENISVAVSNSNKNRANPACQNSDKLKTKIDTKKELAKSAKVSHDTIARVEKIEKQASPEIKEKLNNNEISINQAYQEVQRTEKAEVKKKVEQQYIEKAKTSKDNNIINGDSVIELSKLPDGYIDCVVTDPPYGIDYVSNRRVIENNVAKKVGNDTKENAFIVLDDVCKLLQVKTKENAHLYFFTSWKVYSEFEKIIGKYFKIKNMIVWKKNNWSMGDLDGNYAEQHEIIIFATKGKRKLIGSRDTNVLEFDRVSSNKLLHSCEKPLDLLAYIIKKSTYEGETVADPFAGSGSTLLASKETKRNYWGCELDENHYNIAKGRLA